LLTNGKHTFGFQEQKAPTQNANNNYRRNSILLDFAPDWVKILLQKERVTNPMKTLTSLMINNKPPTLPAVPPRPSLKAYVPSAALQSTASTSSISTANMADEFETVDSNSARIGESSQSRSVPSTSMAAQPRSRRFTPAFTFENDVEKDDTEASARVFETKLEHNRRLMAAIRIQKVFRGYIARKKYKLLKSQPKRKLFSFGAAAFIQASTTPQTSTPPPAPIGEY
jgi:hypothetical protein